MARSPAKPKGIMDELYNKILIAKEVEHRPPSIRASGMPFCPIKFVYKYYDYHQTGHGINDYQKDFYCNIGTCVHSTVQKWIPQVNPGYILGNWECNNCGDWIKDPKAPRGQYFKKLVVYNKVGPIPCPNCKKMMDYNEFEITFPDAPITGHTDGVLLLLDKVKCFETYKLPTGGYDVDFINTYISKKNKEKIPAYVLEWKTTSKHNAYGMKEPAMNYRCQATTYASALKRVIPDVYKLHNIDMRGYLIKYVSRDAPFLTTDDFMTEVDNDKLYLNMCKLVNRLFYAFENKTIGKIRDVKPCKKWPSLYVGKECAYEDLCHSESDKDFIKMLKVVRKEYYLPWLKVQKEK